MHAPPAPAQHREVPTTSTQPRAPAQHSGVGAPGAHTTASPSVQGAARHCPPWQTSAPQQSAPDEQGSPSMLQHRPDSHRRAPQQPSSALHCEAVSPQQRVSPARAAHSRPPSQHATAPGVQGAPAVIAHAGGRHAPAVQVRPAQQSAALAQVSADVRQTQRPPAQLSRPQHSAALAHAPPAARQQTLAPAAPLHASPPQHAAAAAHAAPTAPHSGTSRAQRPLSHESPATQAPAPAQHACPSAPHAAAAHAPAAHRPPAAQAAPQRPQWRASTRRSTQPPAQQVSPAPQALAPAQHACPLPPQVTAGRAHTPLSHPRPAAQGGPAAQHLVLYTNI